MKQNSWNQIYMKSQQVSSLGHYNQPSSTMIDDDHVESKES